MAHGDITHIDIPVDDMARARRFYTTVLGWQIDEVPGYEATRCAGPQPGQAAASRL